MAGAKGRSGGARANTGGKRPGAGRPKKAPALILPDIAATSLLHSDPKAFLTAVMNDPMTDAKLRLDAAKALMPYVHQKLGDVTEKDKKHQAAQRAEEGSGWGELLQ